jgi:hypothetical protein
MNLLNYEKYENKINQLGNLYNYWKKEKDKRWNYINMVLKEVKNINPKNMIEMGTNAIALSDFSDSINLKSVNVDTNNINNKNYLFDAKNIPWPINDKEYDLFVAMQVLEHLEPKQKEVFNEIKRISNYCILTLPYLWNCPNDKLHHDINDVTISKWTGGLTPYKTWISESVSIARNKKPYSFKRIMLCYKFEN